MQAQLQSSSEAKAITPTRHLLVTALIGAALIGYKVHKTPDARLRLESLVDMARVLGDLNENDAALVTALLARPASPHLISPLFKA